MNFYEMNFGVVSLGCVTVLLILTWEPKFYQNARVLIQVSHFLFESEVLVYDGGILMALL